MRNSRLGPLNSVLTTDGERIPLSWTWGNRSPPPKISTFMGAFTAWESITAFDVEATTDPVFLDNVVVRVTHWSLPPPFVSVDEMQSAVGMHVSYVQIDAPRSGGETVFKAPFLSDSGPIYISLRPDEPERLAILARAVTPGVYTFDVGVECHSRDRRCTVWGASGVRVYFAGPEIRDPNATYTVSQPGKVYSAGRRAHWVHFCSQKMS